MNDSLSSHALLCIKIVCMWHCPISDYLLYLSFSDKNKVKRSKARRVIGDFKVMTDEDEKKLKKMLKKIPSYMLAVEVSMGCLQALPWNQHIHFWYFSLCVSTSQRRRRMTRAHAPARRPANCYLHCPRVHIVASLSHYTCVLDRTCWSLTSVHIARISVI